MMTRRCRCRRVMRSRFEIPMLDLFRGVLLGGRGSEE